MEGNTSGERHLVPDVWNCSPASTLVLITTQSKRHDTAASFPGISVLLSITITALYCFFTSESFIYSSGFFQKCSRTLTCLDLPVMDRWDWWWVCDCSQIYSVHLNLCTKLNRCRKVSGSTVFLAADLNWLLWVDEYIERFICNVEKLHMRQNSRIRSCILLSQGLSLVKIKLHENSTHFIRIFFTVATSVQPVDFIVHSDQGKLLSA